MRNGGQNGLCDQVPHEALLSITGTSLVVQGLRDLASTAEQQSVGQDPGSTLKATHNNTLKSLAELKHPINGRC